MKKTLFTVLALTLLAVLLAGCDLDQVVTIDTPAPGTPAVRLTPLPPVPTAAPGEPGNGGYGDPHGQSASWHNLDPDRPAGPGHKLCLRESGLGRAARHLACRRTDYGGGRHRHVRHPGRRRARDRGAKAGETFPDAPQRINGYFLHPRLTVTGRNLFRHFSCHPLFPLIYYAHASPESGSSARKG